MLDTIWPFTSQLPFLHLTIHGYSEAEATEKRYLTMEHLRTGYDGFRMHNLPIIGSFRCARWMASATVKYQTLRSHYNGLRSFACCRIGRTDGRQNWRMILVCAHEWNWYSNRLRIFHRVNRKLVNEARELNVSHHAPCKVQEGIQT